MPTVPEIWGYLAGAGWVYQTARACLVLVGEASLVGEVSPASDMASVSLAGNGADGDARAVLLAKVKVTTAAADVVKSAFHQLPDSFEQ